MTKERSAYDWGVQRKSCPEALRWRESLGESATQADAWKECHRGDWLIWQLWQLPRDEYAVVLPALLRAVDTFVDRAVRQHALECDDPIVEAWAAAWLDGSDRSAESAWASASAASAAASAAYAASAAAWAAETYTAWAVESAESAWGAEYAASAAVSAEAEASSDWEAELQRLAGDIRAKIPVWPGECGENE
jgi:hypothetical protein